MVETYLLNMNEIQARAAQTCLSDYGLYEIFIVKLQNRLSIIAWINEKFLKIPKLNLNLK